MILAPFLHGLIIDNIFRGDRWAPSELFMTPLQFALTVAPPVADDDGYMYLYPSSEVSYSGYARQNIARSLTGWLSTQGNTAVSSGTSGFTRPASNIYFPLCQSSNAQVTGVALCGKQETGQFAHCVAYWHLRSPIQLTSQSPGVYPAISASELGVSFD